MKDSPVLILDEPTASLDIETDSHLLAEIGWLSKDRICLLVSHCLLRKDIADRAIILREGEIVEVGAYAALLAQNREYSRLVGLYHGAGSGRDLDEGLRIYA